MESRGLNALLGRLALLSFLIIGVACVNALDPTKSKKESFDAAETLLYLSGYQGPGNVNGACTTSFAGSALVTEVNATSSDFFTHCDLANGTITSEASAAWDMRFKRYSVATNSGTSGTGTGGSSSCGTTNFAAVTSSSDCAAIAPDSIIAAVSVSPAMAEWYNYDGGTHVLTTKNEVYLIRSSDGADFYKVQMITYYDDAGTSGYPKFRWEKLN